MPSLSVAVESQSSVEWEWAAMVAGSAMELARSGADCLEKAECVVVVEAAIAALECWQFAQPVGLLVELHQNQQHQQQQPVQLAQLAQLAQVPTARRVRWLGSTLPWPLEPLEEINSVRGEATSLAGAR